MARLSGEGLVAMENVRVERRLAAIMAADVVGYSRLVEQDEAKALAAIRALRAEVLEPLVASHGGRIVKFMGDGAIVEFASAVDAVGCAVALQERTAAAGDVRPQARLLLRIGISLGDVVVEGGDLLGAGVNIAARLEPLAEPGGICISDAVKAQLAGRLHVNFEDAGEHRLKNIEQPVRIFRWRRDAAAAEAAPPAAIFESAGRASIAVLPFDNLGGDPAETYFSDGITEDIITGLARFRSLVVIARNSSFAFRGKPVDLAEIGRRLGAAYVVEGSVRKAGERIRITAQLIEAATHAHVWAERYDRRLDDIFAVQDEVAQMIVAALFGRVQEAGMQRSARIPTASLTAHDCVLRGIAHFRNYGADDNRQALEMFERAVALDPRYALPHAYLALVPVTIQGSASAPEDVLQAALAKAQHAVELDPHESRCHRILSTIYLYERSYDLAEHHLARALELNPNDFDGVMQKGRILAARGKPEEAIPWLNAAVRLNPLHPAYFNAAFAVAYYSLGRYGEALQALQRMRNVGQWSLARHAACCAKLGDAPAAAAAAAETLRLKPDFSIADYMKRDVLLERPEDQEHLRDGLAKAGLPP